MWVTAMNKIKMFNPSSGLKRLLAGFLIAAMVCSVFPAAAFADGEWNWIFEGKTDEAADVAAAPAAAPAPVPVPEDYKAPDELIVGHTTELRGDFFTEMFGNNTSDIDVRALLHGYNLVEWDQNQATYVINPDVVTGIQVTEDPNGNHN